MSTMVVKVKDYIVVYILKCFSVQEINKFTSSKVALLHSDSKFRQNFIGTPLLDQTANVLLR